ncbi:EAL domain-containing protein [Agrobacterium larrymoorei]|uniref:EAL domain-containing protein n=1 Tax=Agrobacterium larrymoorei TaxID=160699 RepID=A0A4D7DZJ8_9HYPH|nr:EAL domain-containing protein [Agrobacterium larrymoorei]QCI97300.1 EAL domain-containing protein [Agrobacterium larrymoorei]QYA07265.1 EAL domain-containing protein [Agrobacterium larrymoorei]
MTHSVERRFIAIVSGVLLAVVAPLFTILLTLSYNESISSQRDRLEILIIANAQALGRPLWDLDDETINQITGTLVADPAIYMVKVKDSFGQLDVTQTTGTGQPDDTSFLTRDILYKNLDGETKVGTITIFFRNVGLFSSLSRIELSFLSIFVLSILTIFLSAIIGNRLMIMKPLLRLTAAIEATRRLGSRHHVDWRSSDEMGRLARSFNEMQIQLEREEHEIKRAHRRTTEIYNRTPAMLFSLDVRDRIAAVSDYWVEATGYSRRDALARNFEDLLHAKDRESFRQRRKHHAAMDGKSTDADLTVRFICADGRLMDVLISEKALNSADEKDGSEVLSIMTDVTELRRSEKRNRLQAISDHLTGLLNRQGFESMLDQQIMEADASQTELACLFIDLDRFKGINDNLGHAAGDAVLKEFVVRLNRMLTPMDSASRLGGDEFALLLAGPDVQERALALCDQISAMFEEPFLVASQSVRLSASIGLAIYPEHAGSASELLQNSDLAMYTRKRAGKNGAQVFDPAIMNEARERAEIEQDIEQAIEGDWFEAHFQPIQELDSGVTRGFEALMRLNHPRKGILPPGPIIGVAEENGSIARIGNVILEHSLHNLAEVSKLPGLEKAYVAVNFSAQQFEPGLPTRIAGLLYRHGIIPHRLIVEITEAVLMHDDPQIRAVLNAIRQLGCRIALDDFGTGYSSLSYLNRFPVDIVKIDQSFTRSISDDVSDVSTRSRMLVEGISAISHKMNCIVIAEGIETEQQKAMLRDIGVDCGQGYLFARPQPIRTLMANYIMPVEDERMEKVGT